MPHHHKKVVRCESISVFNDHSEVVSHVSDHVVELVFLVLRLHTLLELVGFSILLLWRFWLLFRLIDSNLFLFFAGSGVQKLLSETVKDFVVNRGGVFSNWLESGYPFAFSSDSHPFEIFLHLWVARVISIEVSALRLQYTRPLIAQSIQGLDQIATKQLLLPVKIFA